MYSNAYPQGLQLLIGLGWCPSTGNFNTGQGKDTDPMETGRAGSVLLGLLQSLVQEMIVSTLGLQCSVPKQFIFNHRLWPGL